MLHREGKATIMITLIFLFVLNGAIGYFFPETVWLQNIFIGLSIVFLVIILQFFRNPSFKPTLGDNLVISPADGKVVVIEEVMETATRFQVWLNILNTIRVNTLWPGILNRARKMKEPPRSSKETIKYRSYSGKLPGHWPNGLCGM
jgi:hypothetical protein